MEGNNKPRTVGLKLGSILNMSEIVASRFRDSGATDTFELPALLCGWKLMT